MKDRIEQKQFRAEWGPGKENLADYTTKFHIPAHHKKMRPIQLFIKDQSPSTLKGCAKIMNLVSIEKTAPQQAVTKTARAALIYIVYMTQRHTTRVIYNLLTTPQLLTQ